MIELWQTEWCPASRRVRQRLTELDVTYVAHQVPVDKADRGVLLAETGVDSIPALVLDDGAPVIGEEPIIAWLDTNFADPAGAEAHREKAAKVRRRAMQEAADELLARPESHPETIEVSR
jgi:glutathione S-transferase